MTPTQFLRELKKELKTHPEITSVMYPNIRFNYGDVVYCPITLLCKLKTSAFFPTSSFVEAANKLGLTQRSTIYIVNAADGAWLHRKPIVKLRDKLKELINDD